MHLVDGFPKREVARRLGVDVKTVRRALELEAAPQRRSSPPRGRLLDPFRGQIERWMQEDPRITAKRIGDLLRPQTGGLTDRAVREYVARARTRLFPRPAFV